MSGTEQANVDALFAQFGLSAELARIKKQLQQDGRMKRPSPTGSKAPSPPVSHQDTTFEAVLQDLPGNNRPDLSDNCTLHSVLSNPGVRRDMTSISSSQFRKSFRFLEPAQDAYGITEGPSEVEHTRRTPSSQPQSQSQSRARESAEVKTEEQEEPPVVGRPVLTETDTTPRPMAKLRISLKGTTASVSGGGGERKRAKRGGGGAG
ncbi:hypothetical protein PTSG_08219 [Salpingoeca rosetta]|uniref:Uncharacterized protein n=1 Tax=Salpingoeca rosetta (strain ATCC 50818 / BSB-021) TaxID=946362 RepID=F2UIC2_SALR5|nr:uncharacterized protein PTSG_08219 [Salpingoeca rosetta]EGD76871.1 hypothetical protein PTSG_08219 [Salpingoeca rosetta]|eukprot:XP_004991243.1 hypothetical protein PTSG_08219 [Salpingoeca rosetta]